MAMEWAIQGDQRAKLCVSSERRLFVDLQRALRYPAKHALSGSQSLLACLPLRLNNNMYSFMTIISMILKTFLNTVMHLPKRLIGESD